MRMYDIIQKKRDGYELTEEEIRFFIHGYTDGSIPDYQASAFTMAVFFNGMTDKETVVLTDAMAHSGDMVDLSCFKDLSADKHSTGGVGDKTSMIIAPVIASLGGKMSKMTGRGLGHTGGTVDKLESIPGYKIDLSSEEFISQVDKIGIAVIGQSGNLTPADKKLYALRDVTATVDSIPLITSSIMSKKLAAGSKNIVLDVKVGSGAFMKTKEDASILAEKMVTIGKMSNRNIAAVLTNMDMPLGEYVGNSLEVKEVLSILNGNVRNDLYEVAVTLAENLYALIFKEDIEVAHKKIVESIESKKAFEKMKEWISYQGGDIKFLENPDLFEKAGIIEPVISEEDGYITHMDTEKIGITSVLLGGGRMKKEDSIDYSAGLRILKKTGDYVKKGEVLSYLYTNDKNALFEAEKTYQSALTFSTEKPEDEPLIYQIIR